jgi:hypothetical protein
MNSVWTVGVAWLKLAARNRFCSWYGCRQAWALRSAAVKAAPILAVPSPRARSSHLNKNNMDTTVSNRP